MGEGMMAEESTSAVQRGGSSAANGWRSMGAVLTGFVVGAALSLGTDVALHAAGLAPALGQPHTDGQLLVATAYRTVYGVLSAYIMARLAPARPLLHALVGGAIGTVLSAAAAVGTWNSGLGPHWYPVALVVLAMPTAWVGGKVGEVTREA